MATQITHISVFLASPSDLAEERIAVKQAIDELNGMVRQMMNVHLDLLTWETDSYPSAGIDAQDVINTQIGNEYDVFIGMMWQKFGTPTGRAGSGTEEEFEIAYNKFVETGGRTKIMLYFSSKAIKPDDIDIEQLAKVKAFKVRAQERGILYGSFNDAESLQTILKMHLTKHIPSIVTSTTNTIEVAKAAVESSDSIRIDNSDEENGYFDLMEIFSENFSEVEKVLSKISEHIEDLGVQMTKKAARIDALNKAPNRSAQSYRILIDSSAG
ncbi:DUF4062 domain-containing protein [Hymenobacter humi]|uniref:DUF4062 domain-containing protein n=1 Tax=Hymenobacter humi TaxID=1411620 RepID=A0ABW2U9W5_9BACT